MENTVLSSFFEGWDDPCLPGRKDGLTREWRDPCYVNPPYSDPDPWVSKAIEEVGKGKRVVMLLRHDSSTRWWSKLHEAGALFSAIMGRLQFSDTGKPAPFASVLVFLNGAVRE
jgi:hypothetical protein